MKCLRSYDSEHHCMFFIHTIHTYNFNKEILAQATQIIMQEAPVAQQPFLSAVTQSNIYIYDTASTKHPL